MAASPRFCSKCGTLANKQIACKSCSRVLYCSDKCRDGDATLHKQVCSRCTSCGVFSGDLVTQPSFHRKDAKFCAECDKAMSIALPYELGWVRGGGPVSSWDVNCNGIVFEMEDPLHVYDSPSNNEIKVREDAEDAASGTAFGEKRVLLQAPPLEATVDESFNPQNTVPAFKVLTRDLKGFTNNFFTKSKEESAQRLRQGIVDTLNRADDFMTDITTHLNILRRHVTDKKQQDEGKISASVVNLKERFATSEFLSSIDKQIAECKSEITLKESELLALEGQGAPPAPPKKELDKKNKELEEIEKTKTRLANELKQVEVVLRKSTEAWQAESARFAKDAELTKQRIEAEQQRTLNQGKGEEEIQSLEEELAKLDLETKRQEWLLRSTSKLLLHQANDDEIMDCVCCAEEVPLAYVVQLYPCAHQHYCMKCFSDFLKKNEEDPKHQAMIKELSFCYVCSEYAKEVSLWTNRAPGAQEYVEIDPSTKRPLLRSDEVDVHFPGLVGVKWTLPDMPLVPPF